MLPEGLKTIGSKAFYNCVNIHKITVPESVTKINANAFSKNTTLVVKKGSYAHQWAVDNDYDYQFTAKGLPEGVTKLYTDFFLKTGWNQRGGKMQFSPEHERVVCSNLADATMIYHYGLQYLGSKSYENYKPAMTITQDFDAKHNIPRIFINSFSDERMYDTDLFLWNHCTVVERQWSGGSVYSNRDKHIMEHVPVKVVMHSPSNRAEIEKLLINSLANNRPVYTIGNSVSPLPYSDHAWLLDGIREKNGKLQVHCNFGWNGGCDGWYNLWEPIKNGMIDYAATFSLFREIIPLEGEELKAWKPTALKNGHLFIPNGRTYIPARSYQNNSDIKSLSLPNTITTINNSTFVGCANLTELTIPESITTINTQSFKDCSGIKTIYYNATKASIAGENANAPFAGCTGVTKVIVKEGVVKVPPTIFLQCTALQTIQIPSSVTEIGRTPFPKTTKVICSAGSFADTWARQNGYQVRNNY